MVSDDIVRHSEADTAPLITDAEQRARQEAQNALRQAEQVDAYIIAALENDRPFRLRASVILDLNRKAIESINSYAGNYRPAGVTIGQSKHAPPGAHLVPELVEDLCDYVNGHWIDCTAIHLASYVLWRLNWIHPFADGNGRTARATSYLVLCAKLRALLPGPKTIPEQIIARRAEYYDALEAADAIDANNRNIGQSANTVVKLEELMKIMLADQLVSSYVMATGDRL